MPSERRRVRFVGHVQGVGFRFTAARLAPGFAVAGFVRNEPDGSVVLEAQGDPSQIQAFLRAIHGELGPKIDQGDESTITPETIDGLGTFDIRY